MKCADRVEAIRHTVRIQVSQPYGKDCRFANEGNARLEVLRPSGEKAQTSSAVLPARSFNCTCRLKRVDAGRPINSRMNGNKSTGEADYNLMMEALLALNTTI
eukprot:IDg14417t1